MSQNNSEQKAYAYVVGLDASEMLELAESLRELAEGKETTAGVIVNDSCVVFCDNSRYQDTVDNIKSAVNKGA